MLYLQKTACLCFLLLALGCAQGGSDPYAGVLRSQDFSITPEEEKLVSALRDVMEGTKSDRRTVFERLGFPLDGPILEKWNKRLRDVYGSSQDREEKVARRIHGEYAQAVAEHAKRLSQCNENKIGIGSWSDDLKNRFGEAYVKEHAGDVGAVLFLIHMKRGQTCMEETRKNLLQAEWRDHSLQKRQLQELAEFYESEDLTAAEKDRMTPALRTAKTYLSLMDKAGVSNLIFLKQDLETEERLKGLPAPLVDFLSAHPAFSNAFDMDFPRVMDALHGER